MFLPTQHEDYLHIWTEGLATLHDPKGGFSPPSLNAGVPNGQPLGQLDETVPLPLTVAQLQVLATAQSHESLWVSYSFHLPHLMSFKLDRLQMTWQALAAHHPILRTMLEDCDDVTKTSKQLVTKHIFPMCLGSWQPEPLKRTIPYMVYNQHHTGSSTLTLHYNHALLDDRSILLIWQDFNIFYHGFGFPARVPFSDHLAHSLAETPTDPDSISLVDTAPIRYASLPPVSESQTPLVERTMHLDKILMMQLAKNSQTDLHTILTAAWAYVFSRHVESSQTAFYTNIRPRLGLQGDTIGHLETVVPLQVSVDLGESVDGFLQRLHTSMVTAGTSLVGSKQNGGSGLQAGFYITELGLPNCEPSRRMGDIPLQVCICLATPSITVRHYEAISGARGRAILNHMQEVLYGLADSRTTTLRSVTLTSVLERTELLSFAQPRIPSEGVVPRTVHSMIEETAGLRSQDVAVQAMPGSTLTFSELNALSNRVARQLLATPQAQHSSIIPIHLGASANLVVAILAVLKAGKAYVILDPSSPSSRNLYIVRDVGASCMITDGTAPILEGTSEATRVETLDIQLLLDSAAQREEVNVDLRVSHDATAYIIYTSGTQGTPKGVVVSHRAAAAGIACASEKPGSRNLLFYNPIFSAAQRTILSTLAHGACLCIASRDTLHTTLKQVVNEMKVTKLGITSSTIGLLRPSDVPTLRQITLTGERLDQAIVDAWAGRVELRNGYGLSECTQLSFGRPVGEGGEDDPGPNVVGRPSDTTAAYILDANTTDLTPLYVPGELCLEGPQLASGYLNKPELTARSFVPSPFTEGAALYRTGDMAIRRGDGSIEIVGRIDFQAKINGQRVEPGEVAAIIRGQDVVKDAAVVACTVAGDDQTVLVTGIVPRSRSDTGGVSDSQWSDLVTELRNRVSLSLPVFMVPRYWVRLDELPRNANGKLDVRQLRINVQTMSREALLRSSSRHIDCSGESDLDIREVSMRSAWSTVLAIPVPSISKHHSFLELGGDSLKALSVISEVLHADWAITLGDLMRAGSLAEAATHMTAQHEGAGSSQLDIPAFSMAPEGLDLDLYREEYEDAYPATELQSSIISAHATAGGYVYSRTFSVAGHEVNWEALRHAFDQVIGQNPIYRTVFQPSQARFVQAVKKHYSLPWQFVDLEMIQDLRVEDLIREQKWLDLDLAETAIRVVVLNHSLLIVSMHHAIFDFWSSNFLFRDVTAIYLGQPALPRAPFNAFVRQVESMNTVEMEQFWKTYLEGATPTRLEAEKSFVPNTSSKRQIGNLRAFTSGSGFSIGVVLYLAWAIVLAKHTGTQDVTFATTLSGRDVPLKGIQELNGPTLTTVPFRVLLEDGMTVSQGLAHVQSSLWKLVGHAQYGLRRALLAGAHSPQLFDTLVNFLVTSSAATESALDPPLLKPYGEKPLWQTGYTTLEVQESVQEPGIFEIGLSGTLDPTRTELIVEEVTHVLEVIVGGGQKRIGELDVITPSERLHLLALSPPVESQDALLHHKFEEVACRMPSRLAIQTLESAACTYNDLNKTANRLARYLRTKGIGPNRLVPICLPKSVEAIVATLAVLKAGGAFVPLDADNPPERNNFIVQDVSGTIVLTDENSRSIFDGQSHHVEVVDLYRVDTTGLEDTDLDCVDVGLGADSLAYCIYTSGSTGLPKGVLVSHRAISAGIDSIIEAESVEPDWRLLQFSNFVFDVSISDVFCILGVGATLCMAPMEDMLSDLSKVANDLEVTRLFVTPTVARLLRPQDVPKVQGIYLAGEPVPQDVANAWTEMGRVVMNCYGPTEASVLSVAGHMGAGGDSRIIGRPLKNIQAMVLEPTGRSSLQLAPYGAVGELCLAGPQLAQGYLGRPEATAKAFTTRDGERLYRTGDLVRWLPDGRMRCLGRIDSQVKIHGHRIELGEIESAILRTGPVRDAAVVVHTQKDMSTLVACCALAEERSGRSSPTVDKPGSEEKLEGLLPPTPENTEILTTVEVKLTSLPPYMVPTIWIPMAALPLLPSGKTDRKKLATWVDDLSSDVLQGYAGLDYNTEYVAVETAEEALLQTLWGSIFNCSADEISASSSFLAHGGDSIAAINLVGRARGQGYLLAVGDVLAFPVLQDMARRISPLRVKRSSNVAQALVKMTPELASLLGRSGVMESDIAVVYPVVPGIKDFLVRAKRPEQFWNCQTVRPLPTEIDFDEWVRTTTELTRRNEILRSLWVELGGVWSQVVLARPIMDLEIVHLRDVDEKERYTHQIWDEGFRLGKKPFIKYRLLVLPDGSRDLLIQIHHAMYDGTLLRIFDDEFRALYNGAQPPATVPFGDYVTHMAESDRAGSLGFWRDLLRGSPAPFPSIPNPVARQTHIRNLDRQADLFAATCGVTAPIVFQTAFSLLLARLSGSSDVVYDNLITGRNVGMENAQVIAGTCANFLPFRTSFSTATAADGAGGSGGVRGLLRETQDLFWKTTEHGNVGLDDIYDGSGHSGREASAPRALFLFQPFEPAATLSGAVDRHMRWMVMGMSRVRMPMDYGLHLEVSKTPAGYKLKFMCDPRLFSLSVERGDSSNNRNRSSTSVGTIEDVADMFGVILERIITHSRSSVASILSS